MSTSKSTKGAAHTASDKFSARSTQPKLAPLIAPTLTSTPAQYAGYVEAYNLYRKTLEGFREAAMERMKTRHAARVARREENLATHKLNQFNKARESLGKPPIKVQFGDMPPPATGLKKYLEMYPGSPVCKEISSKGYTECFPPNHLCDPCRKTPDTVWNKAREGKTLKDEIYVKPSDLSNVMSSDKEAFTLVVNKNKERAAARKAKAAAKSKATAKVAAKEKARDAPVVSELIKKLRVTAASKRKLEHRATTNRAMVKAMKDKAERDAFALKQRTALQEARKLAKEAKDQSDREKQFMSVLMMSGVPAQHAQREAKGCTKRQLGTLIQGTFCLY